MVTGPVVWVDGGGAVVVVFSGFSLAREVRWGIRILRCGLLDVRLLKFLAPPAQDLLDLIRLCSASADCGHASTFRA